jgi:hypothetical protein
MRWYVSPGTVRGRSPLVGAHRPPSDRQFDGPEAFVPERTPNDQIEFDRRR